MIRLHGASSARVPSGHTPCARHHVQAGQLYLRELRGLEASARVTRERSIAIDSHWVAVQTPSGSSWWSLLVDFGVPKYSLYRSLVVEFPQRYGIFKGPVSMFSCFCVSCHGIRSCTFRLAISHECGLNHETIEAVGHYREDFTAS